MNPADQPADDQSPADDPATGDGATSATPAESGKPAEEFPTGWAGLLARHRWIVFVLPLLVYMVVGSFQPTRTAEPATAEENPFADEPASPTAGAEESDTDKAAWFGGGLDYGWYPVFYAVQIALTIVAMVLVLPGYREFPCRVSPLAFVVGIVGVVVWVGLCELHLERQLQQDVLTPLGLGDWISLGARAAYNPFVELKGNPLGLAAFLAIRFFGLVVIVAVIEEFFLRGFVMRFAVDADWWKVRFGTATTISVIVGTAYGVLSHPAEMFAAAAWFSLITWLMVKTRNIWDCVAAHAVTNLLLGVYVVSRGRWELW